MEKPFKCAQCFENHNRYWDKLFCSERCEKLFYEHAPIKLINKIHKEKMEAEENRKKERKLI